MYGRSELIFLLHSNILDSVLYIFFSLFFYKLYNIFFFRFLNKMFNPGKVRNILGVI